jgi:hypothetical protein
MHMRKNRAGAAAAMSPCQSFCSVLLFVLVITLLSKQCCYDEGNDSSLDRCLSGLLLKDHTLVSSEKFVLLIAGT